jgi:hypothetical protein
VAVVERHVQSPLRLQGLANCVIGGLSRRGLRGARSEVTIRGGGRDKRWDVGWAAHGKYRLAVSLKSILRNLAGTVPNRLDDLMGEAANVQLFSPEIVVGYVMVFDVGQEPGTGERSWCEILTDRLLRLSGRRAPHWSIGTIDAAAVITVDFRDGPHLMGGERELDAMLNALVAEVRSRNPGI